MDYYSTNAPQNRVPRRDGAIYRYRLPRWRYIAAIQHTKQKHIFAADFQRRITNAINPQYLQMVWFTIWYMVFDATFNNFSAISWRSVLLVEETGGPGENHRPVASHWQTLSHNVVLCIEYTSPWTGFELTTLVVIGTDCTGSCKSNYYPITAMMAPLQMVAER